MVKFLIQRPVAVLMAFLAMVIIGMITYFTLPVSLLPDIPIPDITVQVSMPNGSARELENTVVTPLRRQLMQVTRLRDIKSETRDGGAQVNLRFDYGTNINLAFIEVNEKIDAAMNYMPRDLERPRVIKASATDIPVFYLNLTLRDDGAYGKTGMEPFLAMSEFAETVIKRRIEQLPEVTMVDATGLVSKEVQILPDMDKLEIAGITLTDIETAIKNNNIEAGSMIIRNGYYEYNVKLSTLLRTTEDIENIYLRRAERIYRMKDLCSVGIVPGEERGFSLVNGKRAVTLAIIKQSAENMEDMKKALDATIGHFRKLYPDIEFTVNRNQTELLDYTISNLKQNFLMGFILICIVAFIFLGDAKSPSIIGISMIVSLVMCFQFFYFFGKSFNIISLSGLVLALGMMIDNAIIITENISQYRERGLSLEEACVIGTTEVITPMLSSTLTTIAVFLPLIFLSGIAGAIFVDEAFSVSVGLLVSYFTGIMLMPVLYRLVYAKSFTRRDFGGYLRKYQERLNRMLYGWYDSLIGFTFAHKPLTVALIIAVFPLCMILFNVIPKTGMPAVDQVELLTHIDWGENIHLDENRSRMDGLCRAIDSLVLEHSVYVGRQQFILDNERKMPASESELYVKAASARMAERTQEKLHSLIKSGYPLATASFAPPETVFEKIFVTGESDIVTELYYGNRQETPDAVEIRDIEKRLDELSGERSEGVTFEKEMSLHVDRERLLLYDVSYAAIEQIVRTAFRDNRIATLRSYQQYLPIIITGEERTIGEILRKTLVRTNANAGAGISEERRQVPLSYFVSVVPTEGLKTIVAGKNGEYVPVSYRHVKDPEELMSKTRAEISGAKSWDVSFSGNYFSNRKMLGELTVVLIISILLMYFILAAQFESFLQPLIVLVEIPIDVAVALLSLWVFGHTLNLMSAIGIVVTCGIIINDSILKIDMINELRKGGMPLMEAIHTAGHRRLRAIIMTSLTTVAGIVPMMFAGDLGSEIQKPLAVAMISSMIVGTLVSLYIIPLVYWWIYRRRAAGIETVNK
ncbi:MAG: efflux RND transporter permease subunit [Tannerella sp.]|jgi:multidrug efflux pump subunit AcrB|nr:efflux RND transporter permease subunit [Tannerella sp.]